MLEIVSKSFAERVGASLSALAGRDATVQFTSLESAKAGNCRRRCRCPASLAVVRLKPLPGLAFITVEPAPVARAAGWILRRLGTRHHRTQAAIAPAALRFLALMLRSFARRLDRGMGPVMPLELELVKQETNPRLMQLGGPQEVNAGR